MFYMTALTDDRIRELRETAAEVRGRAPDRTSPHRLRELRFRVDTLVVTKGGSLALSARTVAAAGPLFGLLT